MKRGLIQDAKGRRCNFLHFFYHTRIKGENRSRCLHSTFDVSADNGFVHGDEYDED